MGNDAIVLLIHGLACDESDWDPVISLLHEQDQSVLTVDLRGHGKSSDLPGPYSIEAMADDIAQLVRDLNLENLIVIGHSMGTRVALALCNHCQDKINQIIFIDGSCQADGDPQLARQTVYDLLADPAVYRNFLTSMYQQMFFSEELLVRHDVIVERALAMKSDVITELLAEMRAWDASSMTNSLQRLNASTRTRFKVLQSTRLDGTMNRRTLSAIEDYDYLGMLRKFVGRAVIEIIEDTGHFIQLEKPQAIIDLIGRRL